MKKSNFSDSQIMDALKRVEAGLPSQRQGLQMEPQACVSDLLRARVESADQAPQTAGTRQA